MKFTVKIDVKKFIEKGNFRTLKTILEDQEPATILEMIEDLPPEEKVIVFRLLPKELAAHIFSELEPDEQTKLLSLFKEDRIRDILSNMDPDDRAELFDEMPANVVKKLISYLTPEDREITMELLNYPPNSAGRLMTPEYVDLEENMSVNEALKHVRETGKNKETIYTLFVIDKTRKLLGTVELKDLIFADPETKIRDIMKPDPIFVYTTTNQEEVAMIMKKYDLLVIPVVDSEERLVGIITIDDIVDVIEEEATEDIYKMASMETIRTSYLHTSPWNLFRKRVIWLILLLLLESINGNIIKGFDEVLKGMVVVAAFIPTMIGTGGNTGAQISALIIRGFALGELKLKDWWKVLLREAGMGLVIGGVLATVLFLRAFIISHDITVNLAVSVALLTVVVYSNTLGAILPFLARLLKVDPAMMAGPLLTTIIDVTGIGIYFLIVKLITG